MAYQLPGDASSLPGCSDILGGQIRSIGAVAAGQHHSSGLHQQPGGGGGTVSRQLANLVRSLWMWALRKDIMLTAQQIPGASNCVADANQRVQNNKGSHVHTHMH